MRRVQRAWRKAQALLREYDINQPGFDIYALARRLPAVQEVEESQLDEDVSGALVPVHQGKWLIVVNKAHAETRRRFTVAHELAHLLLHQYTVPHADRRLKLRDARSSEGSAFEEIEANQFAAELLMPRELVLEAVHGHAFEYEPGDDAGEAFKELVAKLAKKFKVSEQAMTIRVSSLFS